MDQNLRIKRKKRIRKKIFGTADKPRLTVYRSSKHIYAQIIDDVEQRTILSASSVEKDIKSLPAFENKIKLAKHIGDQLGRRAIERGIKTIVFDRNGYMYHGRIKAMADGAREAGLVF
ncbi:Ribosomal protein L18, bacterial [Candidatus Magnetomorum sp. HK-1]|nr:Ribosomal protein L18, bacterial [Candidatus Magnetomorum sp. HK-1]